jgi:chromate reductase, NAD(P)H dehydrogenase (quinone)
MNILAICGSLRASSLNRALLRAAQELAPDDMNIRIYDTIGDLPLYNAELDGENQPEPVVRLKDAIQSADGLLIGCPEYNYGVSGVLKNAIDWASRPPAKTPLRGKPTAIVGVSGGMSGTMRAQLHLRQILVFTQTPIMLAPEILVPRGSEKFTDGKLTHEQTREFLGKMLVSFEEWVKRFVPEPSAAAPWQRRTGAVEAQG